MITIQIPEIFKDKKWQSIIDKHMKIASEKITNKIQRDLKEVHRYKHQTRNLRNASSVKQLPKTNDQLVNLEVGVDLRKADYGKYVIQGHGSWAGDPFVDSAVDSNRSYIIQTLTAAIDAAVEEINRS